MMNYANTYGHFYTPTFCDVFPDFNEFKKAYADSELDDAQNSLTESALKNLYYLLYARYGNSHTIFTDINQFKYNIFSIIFMYGPSWERKLTLQNKIRNLTDAEMMEGSEAIHTHADNPGEKTSDIDDYIDSKNKTKYKKSKIEGLALASELLTTDVSREFVNRFSKLFIKIIIPYAPLYYETNIEEGDEE